ncbi:MAG TPA: hypothetical protein VK463_07105 [Desulfomonilaceae bacterium]|nr:hypothetical protein [Desulfomonilaceae bacterium]
MSDYKVRLLRNGAQQIYVYNDGPTVFFYDQGNGDIIKEAHPSLLGGFYGDPAHDIDARLLELGETGKLVVLELFQDDEFQAELSFGPPLKAEEWGNTSWSQPKEAFLSLPSGRLRVESMNSLPIGDDEPTDEGACVSVRPGEYLLSIQALSPEYDQNEDDLVPEYYLSLTPLSERGKRPDNHPFVSYPYRSYACKEE